METEKQIRFEYPLQWLAQQKRTEKPQKARFGDRNIFTAGQHLVNELKRLGGKNTIISSNLETKSRGNGFYANQKVEDPGIVVYFDLKGKDKAMACDKWNKPEDNIWALYLSIQAIRGLERWGGSDFLDGLFTGFQALPHYEDNIIIGQQIEQHFQHCRTLEEVELTWKSKRKYMHPDIGGRSEDFSELTNQYKKAKERFSEN